MSCYDDNPLTTRQQHDEECRTGIGHLTGKAGKQEKCHKCVGHGVLPVEPPAQAEQLDMCPKCFHRPHAGTKCGRADGFHPSGCSCEWQPFHPAAPAPGVPPEKCGKPMIANYASILCDLPKGHDGHCSHTFESMAYPPSALAQVSGVVPQGAEQWLDTELWNFAHGLAIDLGVIDPAKEKLIHSAMVAAAIAYKHVLAHAAASQAANAEQDTVTALRELLDEKGIANVELKAKIAQTQQEVVAAHKAYLGKCDDLTKVERERDQAREALRGYGRHTNDCGRKGSIADSPAEQTWEQSKRYWRDCDCGFAQLCGAVPPSEDAPLTQRDEARIRMEAEHRGAVVVYAEDAPATPQLCRCCNREEADPVHSKECAFSGIVGAHQFEPAAASSEKEATPPNQTELLAAYWRALKLHLQRIENETGALRCSIELFESRAEAALKKAERE